jgi:3-oxoacyl-[acyl-carrier-protein] synthase II
MARPEDPRVVISGLGMVTPLGVGRAAFWEGVLQGSSAARPVELFDVTGFSTRFACQVPSSFDPAWFVENRKSLKLMSRAAAFAASAAALALQDAGLPPRAEHPDRAGVSMGVGGVGLHDLDYLKTTVEISAELQGWKPRDGVVATVCRHLPPLTPLKLLPNITAGHIAIAHQLWGESITVCTACTSATQAIGEALRVLRRGEMDWMLAGGTDAMINPMGLLGFGMLGVLSTRNEDPGRASRPFDTQRDGFVMGEGAVLLVLERAEHARARGAQVLAELAGYGCASDAYRITDEPEDGRGSVAAMRRALADAGCGPDQVDYVNAHGTSTRMNDLTEARALRTVFGERASRVPVSSTKSQTGHLVAAAGAVETAASALALNAQVLPPSINVEEVDPRLGLDVVANVPRRAQLEVVLKNSFGFGGQNACLVLRRWEAW